MKKLWIVVLLGVIVALLPFAGNRIVKEKIDERLLELSQNGLETKLKKEDKSYLHTQLQYTITVKDEKKFISYLNSFSAKELPPYTKSLLDGAEFAVDIRYSNIPFAEKMTLELYPLKLSDVTMRSLKLNNPEIYSFVTDLLQKRALLYHIEYDIASDEFHGYMKDLDERLSMKDDTNVSIVVKGLEASGKGVLIAPDSLVMQIKQIALSIKDKKNVMRLDMQDMQTTNSFKSRTTYSVSSKISSLKLQVHSLHIDPLASKPMVEDIQMRLKNFALDASSDTQGKDAALFVKSSLDEFGFVQNSKSFTLKGLNYETLLSGVEKESFLKLQEIIEKNAQTQYLSPQTQKEIEDAVKKIFAHGFELNVSDLSLKKLSTPEVKDMDGFAISMQAKLKPAATPSANYQQNPNLFIQNLSVKSDMRFSKSFYALLNRFYPVDIMFASYKKEQNNEILFHVEFKDGMVTINGKRVQ